VYRAYAEIRAQRVPVDECQNSAELLISVRGAAFRPVFTQAPSNENGTASSLGPVAWSANSRWLVVERGLWSYSSDAFGLALLLYDTQSDKASTPDVSGAIQSAIGKTCVLSYAIVGFDAQNLVRLRVQDRLDEIGDRESQCFSNAVEWLFDPLSLTARPAQIVR
jgi:hypothetical protein